MASSPFPRRTPRPPTYALSSPSSSSLTLALSIVLTTAAAALLPTAQAYTWNFDNTPTQCRTLNVTIADSGSGGKGKRDGDSGTPPYRILILPFGLRPLPNTVEARRIMDIPFLSNANQVSFTLRYP